MTAAMHEHTVASGHGDSDALLEAFLALQTPEGFRAELIEGEIVVTPPPDGDHETAVGRIVRQVFRGCERELDFAGTKGLIVPGGRYIPDAAFGPSGVFAGQPSWMEPNGVLMVVEVTSVRPQKDRESKRRGYAAAGIPLYLLVDRDLARVVLHSEPQDGDYHQAVWAPFGKPLDLPAPFDFALRTDELL